MSLEERKYEHKRAYEEILQFYRYAEQLVNTVDDPDTDNPDEQLEVVEPLVLEIEGSTNILAEEFRNYVAEGKILAMLSKKRIETALRNIYLSLRHTQERASGLAVKKATRDLHRTSNHLSEHIKKVHATLQHSTKMELKSYLYSRHGRQPGNVLGATMHKPEHNGD